MQKTIYYSFTTDKKIQDNFIEYLTNQNELITVQVECDSFNSDLAEFVKRIVDTGNNFSLATFLFDIEGINLLEPYKQNIENMDVYARFPLKQNFYDNLTKTVNVLSINKIKVYCMMSEEWFFAVVDLKEKLDKLGIDLFIQRKHTSNGWAEYPENIEKWLKSDHWLRSEQLIDVPLKMVRELFNNKKSVCNCGNSFIRVLPDGKVKRCFTEQLSGWNELGDFSVSPHINELNEYSPCFSKNGQCEYYKKLKIKGFIFDKEDVLVDNRNKKYDIGVVGYGWAYNYGAVLTNYGFMNFLKKEGYNPLMIEKPRDFLNDCYHDEVYVDNFARKFNEKYFKNNLSRIYNDKNDMKALNSICDTFILGSDQTLRYDLHKNGQYYSGMDFLNADKKRIAYSSGMGHFEYMGDDWYRMNLKHYLSKFDYIGVREPSTVYVLKEQFDVNSVNVIDPMYFIEKEDYKYLASNSDEPVEKDCIVAFILTPDKRYKKQFEELSKKLNCKVIIMAEYWLKGLLESQGFENVITPSVESWINHILNAKFVVTDSFHAVYTLMKLQKQFLLVVNNDVDFKRGMARFPIFEEVSALKDRILYHINDISSYDQLMEPIDWNSIYKHFDKQKDFSIKWLKKSLAAKKTIKTTPDSISIEILHDKVNYLQEQIERLSNIISENK